MSTTMHDLLASAVEGRERSLGHHLVAVALGRGSALLQGRQQSEIGLHRLKICDLRGAHIVTQRSEHGLQRKDN